MGLRLLNPLLAPAMNPVFNPMSRLLLVRAKDFLNSPALSRPPLRRRSMHYVVENSSPAPLHRIVGRSAKVLLNPPILHSHIFRRSIKKMLKLTTIDFHYRSSSGSGGSTPPPPHRKHYLKAAFAAGGSTALAVYYFKHRETVPFTNRTRFLLFSTSVEGYLADRIFNTYNKEAKNEFLSPTDPASVRVECISNRIADALRRRGIATAFPLEVVVVKNSAVNACCLPGGKIIVNTGLLNYMTNPEVASVIGHEVGHSIARHSAETVTKSLLMWLLTVFLLALVLDIIKELFGIEIELPRNTEKLVSTLLFTLPLSRRMEKEADYIGLMLLASAGYDPHEALNVMEKLESLSEEKSSKLTSYVSTHPTSEERSKLLSQAMEEALAMYSAHAVGDDINIG